jgi:hypothetical protein
MLCLALGPVLHLGLENPLCLYYPHRRCGGATILAVLVLIETMNTPRPRSTVTFGNRTGLAWREFNSMVPTPPPEVPAEPSDITPVVETSGLGDLDDVTPVVAPRLKTASLGEAPAPAAVAPVVLPPPANPTPTGKGKALLLIAAGLALGALIGLLVYLPAKPKERPRPVPVAAPPVRPAEVVQPIEQDIPTIPTEAPPPSETKSHIEITVQPTDAVLSMDKHATAGSLIKLDVPPSRTPHVVQAAAPGYLTFKKTISYAEDVFLEIKLEKAQPRERSVAQHRPSPPIEAQPRGNEPKPSAQGKPRPALSSPDVEDFGMDLEHPNTKRPTKTMDETDPYYP